MFQGVLGKANAILLLLLLLLVVSLQSSDILTQGHIGCCFAFLTIWQECNLIGHCPEDFTTFVQPEAYRIIVSTL